MRPVTFQIYDLLCRYAATLVDGRLDAGNSQVVGDAIGGAGVTNFLPIDGGHPSSQRKMLPPKWMRPQEERILPGLPVVNK